MSALSCRFCAAPLGTTFVDLGLSPLANSYVEPSDLLSAEAFYPLNVYVCDQCLLVQLPQFHRPDEIFGDYAYFSSYSDSWLAHARAYVEQMSERFGLDGSSQVIEIASNDGYLLQYFQARQVPVLGIEPAANVAEAARRKGIETRCEFFGRETASALAEAGRAADLLLGNNVLAHVPDINDFVAGLSIALARRGVVTMEFPHLLRLVAENQFDTIYHEHFSYLSLRAVRQVFEAHDLVLFDVEQLPTHGGSLRIFARHRDDDSKPIEERVERLLTVEAEAGFDRLEHYLTFGERVRETKRQLLDFLVEAKREGKTIAGYGAPAKGNTLLNYCGVGTDFVDYTVDRSPHKQGRYLPGSRIPIFAPDRLAETRPDLVWILPWNLRDEIVADMSQVADWGGRFFVAIPSVAYC